MLVISTIMACALIGIISVATYFFKTDSELRIKENNIKITEVITLKVSSDLKNLANDAKIFISSMKGKRNSYERNTFFETEKDFLLIGVYSREDTGLEPININYNYKYLGDSGLDSSGLDRAIQKNAKFFSKSTHGTMMVQNLSEGLSTPLIGISFSRDENSDEIIIVVLKMDHIQNVFQTSGLTEIFMVNSEGAVVVHHDKNVLLSGTKFSDLPIFKVMLLSPLDNGQTRYKYGDSYYLGSFKKLSNVQAGIISTVSEDKAFEEVYNIRRRNIYLMVIVVCLSVIGVFFYSRSLVQPILELVGATKKIEKGQFILNIRPKSSDEIGLLTNSVIHMSQGLLERENMKDAFGKFVNKEMAELALKGELKLGGEKKYCAIFFSDIRGFTAISEKLEPEEVVEFLNQYLSEMVACVNEYHGVVDKFIGDSIMAVWGGLKTYGNNTENAINTALKMRKLLLQFNKGRGSAKKPIIHIGCGINTGYVISGQIGSQEKLEYTVIGDAVNLASRVESASKAFGTDILISENSYKETEGIFKVEKMPAIKVKGKTEPQTVYAVLGREDDPKTPENVKELRKILGIVFKQGDTKGEKYAIV
ncbi:MAG: HAMP domain-containing protein [Leptospiraceae bacterium]|nr:HAMP domain-containing protein [Leptospiraceae bacterium]MCK6380679.1 HAMP domain-containing protein [Leptospiraceae bacterium]NUM42083.1 HAMP domain-containing protein [Leptospiraceae bacterium]